MLDFFAPFPFQFGNFVSDDEISLDGVVVIETARRRGKRRDVVVSVKYWKTFFFDGTSASSAGASIDVENNIQPVLTSGKFKLGPPPTPLEFPDLP